MAKTQLERSHSVWSNTKLTCICLLTALFFVCFFLALGLKNQLDFTLWLVMVALSGVLTLLGLIMFNGFKR